MEEIEPTWTNTLPVWWSFIWRVILFGIIATIIAGGIAGFILALIGKPELAETVGGIVGYFIGIPVSVWCFKIILNKRYNGYSVRLIKDETV